MNKVSLLPDIAPPRKRRNRTPKQLGEHRDYIESQQEMHICLSLVDMQQMTEMVMVNCETSLASCLL